MTDVPETLLIMSTIGVPLYSARGLTQTLTPVESSKPQPRYTVNGELRFIGMPQMRKYDSTITCKDLQAPAFGGLWAGTVILVNCVAELAYLTSGGSAERGVVAGSSHVIGLYTYYRPQITFMVVDFHLGNDEYQHEYEWQLVLREQ